MLCACGPRVIGVNKVDAACIEGRMAQDELFATGSGDAIHDAAAEPEGDARLLRPERNQKRFEQYSLDELVDKDHRVRMFARALKRVDLNQFSERVAARGSNAGRPAIDPEILILLWLFATSESISSARELERSCERDSVYRWICGGVRVNHHTLSDFRTKHGQALDALMTQLLGVFMSQGLVNLHRVAQDGMKVRAASGAASFHRKKSLKRALKEARRHVMRMRAEADTGAAGRTARERAAQWRSAQEAEESAMAALEEMDRIESEPRKSDSEPRVSTTDPQARVMKMADGGFRPAYNVQIASDTKSRMIVDIGVIQQGNDFGQAPPRMRAVTQRTGVRPKELLIDGGFAALATIEELETSGMKVFAPVMRRKNARVERGKKRPTDSTAVGRWRRRMATKRAQRIYVERGAVAETINGDLRRWRGFSAFNVKGIEKVSCVALWSAITHNLIRWIALGGPD
jgi:transposase